jgi:hypothetical protein
MARKTKKTKAGTGKGAAPKRTSRRPKSHAPATPLVAPPRPAQESSLPKQDTPSHADFRKALVGVATRTITLVAKRKRIASMTATAGVLITTAKGVLGDWSVGELAIALGLLACFSLTMVYVLAIERRVVPPEPRPFASATAGARQSEPPPTASSAGARPPEISHIDHQSVLPQAFRATR